MNVQEDEDDPSLISDAESVIQGSPMIEIFDDASNLGKENSGETLFGRIW